MALEQALLDTAAALVARLSETRDDRSIADSLQRVGELRRIVDAIGADLAGDLARRSATPEDSLARRLGDRSAADSVARLVGIEHGEALHHVVERGVEQQIAVARVRGDECHVSAPKG